MITPYVTLTVPCCAEINIKSDGPSKSVVPASYFGVYKYFDRASNGKIIWRSENGFYYLFPMDANGGSGWGVSI